MSSPMTAPQMAPVPDASLPMAKIAATNVNVHYGENTP